MQDRFHYNAITLMKVIAMFFITWFHFKWYVPDNFAFIFIGGAIGNSIFFFCSGFLMSIKEERYIGQWLAKKYLRLMPAVWTFFVCVILYEFLRYGDFDPPCLTEWLYPSQFWFVQAILFYFVVTYIYCKLCKFLGKAPNNGTCFNCLFVLFFMVHLGWYHLFVDKGAVSLDEGGIKVWFYWYLFFLLGYYCRSKDLLSKLYAPFRNRGFLIHALLLAFSVILFFLYKRACTSDALIYLQVLVVPTLLLFVVYSCYILCQRLSEIELPNRLKCWLSNLSDMTLDVYVVQIYIIKIIMPEVCFPMNILVSFLFILLVAYIVFKVSDFMKRKLFPL